MRKITILFLVTLCSISAFSMRYLVQSSSTGVTWRAAAAGETLVDLTTEGKTLNAWLTATTFTTADEVWIIKGTYTFSATYAFPTAGLDVYGGFSGTENSVVERSKGTEAWIFSNETILDGNNNTVQIFTPGGARVNTIIDGLTINKAGTGTATTGAGAAIVGRDGMTFRYCKFTNNVSTVNGGGLVLNGGGNVYSSYFGNNKGNSGGGLHCGTGAGLTSEIANCLFENNQAAGGANNLGGALRSQAAGTLNINKCIFRNNDAAGNGSAIHVQLAAATNFTTVSNSIIYGNTTKGAVYMLGGTMNNCTVTNNGEGGIYIASNSVASKIYNTAVWGSDTKSGGITSVESNSIAVVQNTAYTSIQSANLTGSKTNNILLDFANDGTTEGVFYPRFTDPANKIYTLRNTSALLQAGQTLASVTTDITGVSRAQGTNYDIGAYEAIQSTINSSGLNFNTYSDISILNGGELTFDNDKKINSFSIGVGGKVTLNSGNTLTSARAYIFNDATNGAGTFVDNNTSSGLTVNNNSTSVQQYLPGGDRAWWYLASPLSDASSNIFSGDQIGKHVEDYLNDGNESTMAPYYTSPFSTPENLTPGRGYVVKRATPASGGTYTFTGGSLNSGNISPIVTRTGTEAAKRGFNLVGNPYPSYLNWDALYNDQTNPATNMRNAIWFRTYDSQSSTMVFHTYGDGDAVPEITSPKIAPMQAFWVKVDKDNTPASLTLKNTHRSHFTEGVNPLKVKTTDHRQRLRLVVRNGIATDETLLVGKSYAQDGQDSYDIDKMSNTNPAIPEIYSLIQDEELVINSMNALSEGKSAILGFRPGQAGSFTIEATQLENIDAQVVLVDNLNGKETDLTAGATYSFTSDATASNDRFSVLFRAPGVVTGVDKTDSRLFVNTSEGRIVINGTTAGSIVRVYNTIGQQLITTEATNSRTELSRSFTHGIYLVKVNNKTIKVTVK